MAVTVQGGIYATGAGWIPKGANPERNFYNGPKSKKPRSHRVQAYSTDWNKRSATSCQAWSCKKKKQEMKYRGKVQNLTGIYHEVQINASEWELFQIYNKTYRGRNIQVTGVKRESAQRCWEIFGTWVLGPREKIVCGSLLGTSIELLPELPRDVEKQFRKANKGVASGIKALTKAR